MEQEYDNSSNIIYNYYTKILFYEEVLVWTAFLFQTHMVSYYYNKFKYKISNPEREVKISQRLYLISIIGNIIWYINIFIFTKTQGYSVKRLYIISIYSIILSIFIIIDCNNEPELSILFGVFGILYLILNIIYICIKTYFSISLNEHEKNIIIKYNKNINKADNSNN